MLGGLIFALIHAVATIRYRADQVVVGVAINLLAIGVTRFFLKLFFASSSNSPRVAGFGGNIKAAGFDNPLLWLGLLVAPVMAFVIYRTPFGLRVRAAGEHPDAAESVGVSVKRVRYAAVALSGILAGLGGVYLALDQHQFTDQMTPAGIHCDLPVIRRWDQMKAEAACLLVDAAETCRYSCRGATHPIAVSSAS